MARRKNKRKGGNKKSYSEWEDIQDIQGSGGRKNNRRKERMNGKYNLRHMVEGNIDPEDYMGNLEK
jgi:hypothetical protein